MRDAEDRGRVGTRPQADVAGVFASAASDGAGTSAPSRPRGILGAGLITGAADDDPSGIATYSQAGAAYGFGLAWTMLFTLPLLAAVQELAARIGRVTGRGIAANLALLLPRPLLLAVILLLAVANVVNLGADLGAMGEALRLVIGGPAHLYVILFGLASALAAIFIHYAQYVRMLRWLTLALLAYVATALAVPVDWFDVAANVVVPRIDLSSSYLTMVTAVFGTTIAPYLVFWQAAEEVEDLGSAGPGDLEHDLNARRGEFKRIRLDTWFGIGFSNLVGLFIIIATAATLHRAGITDIASAEQAATALRPLAGDLAFFAFSAGIIGTGLLAVPVLAGSAAYAVGEALGRPVGLSRRPREARTFDSVIAAATIIGTALHFSPVDPMAALVASAVLNGLLVVPILAALLIVGSSRRVMGSALPSWRLRALAGTTVLVMGAAAVALVASWFR